MADNLEAVKKMAQRALDYQEIQNVFNMHAYYLEQHQMTEELDKIWSQKRDDICFSQNWGIWVGQRTVREHYTEHSIEVKQKLLDEKRKWHPDIPNDIKYWRAGEFGLHTLTNPQIEVAGDGDTAKGMWYTPGFSTVFNYQTGKWEATWLFERYAVDFVKEDGKWKIWHFCVCCDFNCTFEKSWVKVAEERGSASTEAVVELPEEALHPTLPGHAYEGYHTKRIPGEFPKPPEPYETFSETFSYGP